MIEHRPVAGAAAVEDGQREQRADDAAECEGETATTDQGAASGRGAAASIGEPRYHGRKFTLPGVSQIVYPSLTVDSFAGGRLALRLERSSVTLAPRPRRRFSRTAKTLLLASLVALVAVVASPVAQAKEKKKQNCARAIINDWYGDGQIDKQLRAPLLQGGDPRAPVDIVKDYSHATEDILRALAYAKKGQPDPGRARTRPAGDRHDLRIVIPGATTRPATDDDGTVPGPARDSRRSAERRRHLGPVVDPDSAARARRARLAAARCRRRRLRQPPPPGRRAGATTRRRSDASHAGRRWATASRRVSFVREKGLFSYALCGVFETRLVLFGASRSVVRWASYTPPSLRMTPSS